MATLNVPSDYATIAAAMAAARPGDTIKVASGYRGRGTASFTDDDLTIDAPSDVTGFYFAKPLSAKVSTVTVTGGASVKIKAYNASIKTGAGNDVIDCAPSDDRIDSGAGDDVVFIRDAYQAIVKTGSGNDVLFVRRLSSSGEWASKPTGYDGGGGIDTVRATELGKARYTNFEILDTNKVAASISQLKSFQSIVDSQRDHTQIRITLRGAGGEIDFSKLVARSDSVYIDGRNFWAGITVTGTAKADVILGANYQNVIDGAGGNDVIRLSEYHGARGAVDGGSGYDVLHAVDLQRYSVINVEELNVLSGWSGRQPVHTTVDQIGAFQKITASPTRGSQIELILSGKGGMLNFANKIEAGDSIEVEAGKLTSGLHLKGSAGDDVIHTTRFDDVIDGGAGDDVIETYTRYDARHRPIDTPSGVDTLKGGAGDDLIVLDGRGRGVVDGGSGHDTVRAGDLTGYTLRGVETLDAATVTASLDQVLSFDTITRRAVPYDPSLGAAGNNAVLFNLVGQGGTLDLSHLLQKGKGAVVDGSRLTSALDVTGTDKADAMVGTVHDDHLRGGLGDDLLFCNSPGSDIVEGGGGSDGFAFRGEFMPGRLSHIVDFSTADMPERDLIVIKGSAFSGVRPGPVGSVAPDIFKDLGTPGATVDYDDRILYNHNTGILAFDPDGAGAQAAFTVAILDNHALLSARDFFLLP